MSRYQVESRESDLSGLRKDLDNSSPRFFGSYSRVRILPSAVAFLLSTCAKLPDFFPGLAKKSSYIEFALDSPRQLAWLS
jgi:hypothetical protein